MSQSRMFPKLKLQYKFSDYSHHFLYIYLYFLLFRKMFIQFVLNLHRHFPFHNLILIEIQYSHTQFSLRRQSSWVWNNIICLIIFLSTFSTETGSKLIKLICVASDSISKDNVDTDVDGEVLGTSHNLGKKNT